MSHKISIVANTSFYLFNFRFNFISTLINNKYEVIIVCPLDKYTKYLIDLGCIHHPINVNSKSKNPFFDLILFFRYYLFYSKIKPDLVLNFTTKPNIYSTIAAKYTKSQTINNISGLGIGFVEKTFISRIIKILYKYSQNMATVVYFQNTDDHNYFLKNNLINNNGFVLPGSGVDINKFKYEKIQFINSNKFIFLFNSRMLYSKGVELLFQAGMKLYKEHYNFEIIIFGQSNVSNSDAISNDQIQNWCKQPFFTYKGFTDDIKSALINSHCVVLPSFYKEGTPKSLLEALSIGRPIITTDMPGCRDTVSNLNGFLVKPRDVNSLFESMKRILNLSFDDLITMGENSRQLAVNKFDDNIVINEYMSCIKKCLKNYK